MWSINDKKNLLKLNKDKLLKRNYNFLFKINTLNSFDKINFFKDDATKIQKVKS